MQINIYKKQVHDNANHDHTVSVEEKTHPHLMTEDGLYFSCDDMKINQ
jgi:hypothetical protein